MTGSPTITIEGKIPGRNRPLFDGFEMPLPREAERTDSRLTLRALLTRVVTGEVEAFRSRQEERRVLRALTEADIAQGVMKGKVVPGGQDLRQEVGLQAALTTALQAFDDGVYYVFVDDEQATALDQEVYLRPESRVTFIRLVALAGG